MVCSLKQSQPCKCITLDDFDFENVSFEEICNNELQSVSVSEDSIDDFAERYVAKIIADACELHFKAIKSKEKQPLRVSDTFVDNYIE